MLDDLFAADNDAAARDLIAKPLPVSAAKPAKFSAWSAIPRGVAVAAGEVGASLSDLAGAAVALRDADPKQLDRGGLPASAFSSELGDTVRDFWRGFKPDPETASTAEQVLFGFSRGLAKLIPATLAAGPAGAVGVGVEEAMTVSDDLRRQGVPEGARGLAGLVQGAGMASAALPLLGRTLAETAALYVAGGPGGFMAQQALTRKVLEHAGQEKIAGNYDPFDPIGLTVAAAIPLVFTAAGLRGQKLRADAKAQADFVAGPRPSEPTPIAAAVAEAVRAPELSPEVVDAAMVQNSRDFAAAQTPAVVAHAEAWRGPVTENPNFKAWFGDSKVVDAEGSPLVVYHGTQTPGFDSFMRGKVPPIGGVRFGDAQGFYFTDNPGYASDYGDTVMPVYLSMKNPYIVAADQFDHTYVSAARRAELEAQGYDGIMAPEVEGGRFGEIVVFRPEQIKSAIGNSGRFDPNSASLTDPVPRDAETRIVRNLPPSDSLALPPAPTADEVGRFGKVENIPLGMTRATQSRMEWGRFDAGDYAPPLVEGFSDIPLAVRKLDGEVLVFDGHHRTADAINRGETEMPMRVLEARDYAPEFAGRKPAPSTISDDDLMAELSAPPKPAAEAGDPIAKLNEPADAKPKPAADPIMSTVATRVADLESTAPDMVVRVDADGRHVTLAEDLAEVRRLAAEGTDDTLGALDADLLQVAVNCALSSGG